MKRNSVKQFLLSFETYLCLPIKSRSLLFIGRIREILGQQLLNSEWNGNIQKMFEMLFCYNKRTQQNFVHSPS